MNDTPSLLPPSTGQGLRDMEQATSRISHLPVDIAQLQNPDTCPAHLLGWLAWALSVAEWNPNWPEAIKRATIKASVMVHRRKGTLAAVKDVLNAAGYGDAIIIEGGATAVGADWVVGDSQPVGGPSHWAEYWVVLKDTITPQYLKNLIPILQDTAPARAHLTRVIVDNVNQAVGQNWAVGDQTVNVGSAYRIEDFQNG